VLTRMWLAFRVRVPHHPLLDVARHESGYTALYAVSCFK